MSGYLIDTDTIIDVLRGEDRARQILTDLSLRNEVLTVSVITVGELYEGAFYGRNSSSEVARVQNLLESFTEISDLTQPVVVRVAIVRGSLSRNVRNQLGDLDLLIAATALQHDRILLTGNVRDFRHITGLRIANYRDM